MKRNFGLYLTVPRFLTFKITNNLKRIYLDVDIPSNKMHLTAFYTDSPSELELELLDDIATDSNAHIPDLLLDYHIKLVKDLKENEKHEFIVFAVYEGP